MKCTGLSGPMVTNQCTVLINALQTPSVATLHGQPRWAVKPGAPGAPTGLRQKLHSTFSLNLQRGLDQSPQAIISETQDCGKEEKMHWNNFLLCFVLFCNFLKFLLSLTGLVHFQKIIPSICGWSSISIIFQ